MLAWRAQASYRKRFSPDQGNWKQGPKGNPGAGKLAPTEFLTGLILSKVCYCAGVKRRLCNACFQIIGRVFADLSRAALFWDVRSALAHDPGTSRTVSMVSVYSVWETLPMKSRSGSQDMIREEKALLSKIAREQARFSLEVRKDDRR